MEIDQFEIYMGNSIFFILYFKESENIFFVWIVSSMGKWGILKNTNVYFFLILNYVLHKIRARATSFFLG